MATEVTVELSDDLAHQVDERLVEIETDRLAEELPDADREEIEAAVRRRFGVDK